MGYPGAAFNTTVITSATVEEVGQRLVTGLAGLGYEVAVPQPGTVVATRTYRPTWAVVLAVCSALLFLVGLLFLLVKRSEAVTFLIRRHPRGAEIVVSGIAIPEMAIRANRVLRDLPDLTDAGGAPARLVDPVVVETSSLMSGAGLTAPPRSAPSTSARPPSPPPVTAATLAQSATMTSSVPTVTTSTPQATCVECGAGLRFDRRFCGSCGARQPAPCPACGESVMSDDRFCTGCGRRVEAGIRAHDATVDGAAS